MLAIEAQLENAIKDVNKMRMSDGNKKAVALIIESLGTKLNPACMVDNTTKTYTYGNAKFVQVCPKNSIVVNYQNEVSRRQGSIEYIKMLNILKSLTESDVKDTEKINELTTELQELEIVIKEKYRDEADIITDLIVGSIKGNPLKKGSLIVEGSEVVIDDYIDQISEFPPELRQILMENATDLFTIRKAEEKN